MLNFKTLVRNAIATFDGTDKLNAKDEAVRRLGIASELASAGEKAKKAAKTTLKGLGILADSYQPGAQTIYDSNKFAVIAVTKEPSMTLKVECLQAELQRRGMSSKAIADIISAAHGSNKAATSLQVEQK